MLQCLEIIFLCLKKLPDFCDDVDEDFMPPSIEELMQQGQSMNPENMRENLMAGFCHRLERQVTMFQMKNVAVSFFVL